MERKSVCVIGGGFAGLSAAVFLSQHKEFAVTLIESSPRLGGRAYSFYDKTLNEYIDNGQHILAGWYKNTFDFLKIIGSFDKLKFQHSLEVKLVDLNAKTVTIKASASGSLSNAVSGFFTLGPFTFFDKLAGLKMISAIKFSRFSTAELKGMTVSDLFRRTKQTVNLKKYFWEPLVVAVFNCKPEKASAYQFMNIAKEGFTKRGAAGLVFPQSNLNELYVNPANEYFKNNNVEVITSAGSCRLRFSDDKAGMVIFENGGSRVFDYYISAVPFYDLKMLVGEDVFEKEFKLVKKLETSPIINIHYRFEGGGLDEVIHEDYLGVTGANIQWIFKNSPEHLCLVISGADELVDKKNEELIEISKSELYKCLPGIEKLNLVYTKVIKEKRATFLPSPESNFARPASTTKFPNFFVVGDWTDTGLPALIEGAVMSSRRCVDILTEENKG